MEKHILQRSSELIELYMNEVELLDGKLKNATSLMDNLRAAEQSYVDCKINNDEFELVLRESQRAYTKYYE